MRNKTTDVSGDFNPPEENKEPARRRLRTKTPVTPVIRAVPIPAPADPAVETFDISEDPDLNERRVSVWLKYNVGKLEKALEKLNIPKEIEVKIKGEFVKKQVDKINKKSMVEMIRKKLNF